MNEKEKIVPNEIIQKFGILDSYQIQSLEQGWNSERDTEKKFNLFLSYFYKMKINNNEEDEKIYEYFVSKIHFWLCFIERKLKLEKEKQTKNKKDDSIDEIIYSDMYLNMFEKILDMYFYEIKKNHTILLKEKYLLNDINNGIFNIITMLNTHDLNKIIEKIKVLFKEKIGGMNFYIETLLNRIELISSKSDEKNKTQSKIIKSKMTKKEAILLLKNIQNYNVNEHKEFIEYFCNKYKDVYQEIDYTYLLKYLLNNKSSCIYKEQNLIINTLVKNALEKFKKENSNNKLVDLITNYKKEIEPIEKILCDIKIDFEDIFDLEKQKQLVELKNSTIKYYLKNSVLSKSVYEMSRNMTKQERNQKFVLESKQYIDNYYDRLNKTISCGVFENCKEKNFINILQTKIKHDIFDQNPDRIFSLLLCNIAVENNDFSIKINSREIKEQDTTVLELASANIFYIASSYFKDHFYSHIPYYQLYTIDNNKTPVNHSSKMIKFYKNMMEHIIPSYEFLTSDIFENNDTRFIVPNSYHAKEVIIHIFSLMANDPEYCINQNYQILYNENFINNIEQLFKIARLQKIESEAIGYRRFYRYLLLRYIDDFNLKNESERQKFKELINKGHMSDYSWTRITESNGNYKKFILLKENYTQKDVYLIIKKKMIDAFPEYEVVFDTYINYKNDRLETVYNNFYIFIENLL